LTIVIPAASIVTPPTITPPLRHCLRLKDIHNTLNEAQKRIREDYRRNPSTGIGNMRLVGSRKGAAELLVSDLGGSAEDVVTLMPEEPEDMVCVAVFHTASPASLT
jgi:hypothetical protein